MLSSTPKLPLATSMPAEWRDELSHERAIPGRGLCALQRFAFSTGLLVELQFDGWVYLYSARYCYRTWADALEALRTWTGAGDPPGPWIKEKVSGRGGPPREE